MTVLLYALGAAAIAAGIAGLVLPVLPGSLLLVAGVVLVAWAEDFTRVGWGTVAVAAVLGLLMWLADLAAAALGAKAFGASPRSILGASVGLLVGLFLGPAGVVLGPIAGAVLFELTRTPDLRAAGRAGAGAFVGFILGNAVKIALAFVLVGVVVAALVF